jgi:hypothetical protein
LITKFSFENSISDSKNGGVGTDVAHPASRHIKDLLVLYRLQQRSKSFDCYKSITVSMWIKTNPHTGGAHLFMLPKPLLISGVISSH